jgi:hypothetical protein
MDFSRYQTPSMLQRYRTKTEKRHGASVRKHDEYLARVRTEKKTIDPERRVIP